MKNKITSIFLAIKKGKFIYLSAMVILAAILCFFELGRNSLTLDEMSTFTASINWQSLWKIAWTQDANMWLYFILNHFWIKFGTNEFMLRTLSALFGIFTVPVFYVLAKNNWGNKIARIATPLLVLNLCFIFFAQTARGYSLALLLTTLMQYFFLKFAKDTSSRMFFLAYLITATLAMYTYLLIGLIILINYFAIIFLPKPIPWKKIGLFTLGLLVGILPLLLSPSIHGHQLDWLTKPPIIQLPLTFILLGGGSILATVICSLIIIFFLWKKKENAFVENWDRFLIFWLILWTGFPIFFSFVFSFVIKPIFQPQSFNTSLPAFVILVALGLEIIKSYKKLLFKALYVIILALLAIRLVGWYSGSQLKQVIIPNNNPWDWKQVANYVNINDKPGDSIIFYAYYIRNPFEYYFTRLPNPDKTKILEISSGPYDLGGGTGIPEPNIKLLDGLSAKYKRVWLILGYNNTLQLDRKTQWLEVEKELDKSFIVSNDTTLNQIEVKLFERK